MWDSIPGLDSCNLLEMENNSFHFWRNETILITIYLLKGMKNSLYHFTGVWKKNF